MQMFGATGGEGGIGGPAGQQRPGGGKMRIISENASCCAQQISSYKDIQYKVASFPNL